MEPIIYTPSFRQPLPMPITAPTAWNGIEEIIPALIKDFSITPDKALEFGVGDGFSTVALANYFSIVSGVDTFAGDIHAGEIHSAYELVCERLKKWQNISLCKSDYREWTLTDPWTYDLIHIDIVHTYEDTFACGEWALNRSGCVIFHDTLSFPDVMKAVKELGEKFGRTFYNYPHSHGLGILSSKGLAG